jgi:hypothetical protein
MTDIPFDALVGLTIHRADVEARELRRLARAEPLSDEDKDSVRYIIHMLFQSLETEPQREAA